MAEAKRSGHMNLALFAKSKSFKNIILKRNLFVVTYLYLLNVGVCYHVCLVLAGVKGQS